MLGSVEGGRGVGRGRQWVGRCAWRYDEALGVVLKNIVEVFEVLEDVDCCLLAASNFVGFSFGVSIEVHPHDLDQSRGAVLLRL